MNKEQRITNLNLREIPPGFSGIQDPCPTPVYRGIRDLW
jgi:hypothetical protein